MVMLVGGIADGRNIEVHLVNGRPIEEVRIAHIWAPHAVWSQEDGARSFPKMSADVYRFCDGEYRYDRTI